MRHRTKTDTYGNWIKLVKKTNPKTGRKHYSVIIDAYAYVRSPSQYGVRYAIAPSDMYQEWRKHFDPAGNRGMKSGLSWKFSNREEAEQLITLALLKWGDRYEHG